MQNVKKYAFVTTLLISAVLAASVLPGVAAFADDNASDETYYPVAVEHTLTFTDLTGYAIEDSNSIYADDGKVIILEGDTIIRTAETYTIEAVDVQDGVFYKQLQEKADSDPVSYKYTADEWVVETEHDYTPRDYTLLETGYTFVTRSDYRYTYHTSADGLTIVDLNSGITDGQTIAGYSLLTYYDGIVYAVSNNVLYTFDGETPTAKDIIYYKDYEETSTILVGTSLEKIAATAYSSLQKVTVSASTSSTPVYMTEISLSEFNTDETTSKKYFKDGTTFEVTSSSEIKGGDELLLLCEVGNAYIVSYGTQAYIMAQTGGTVSSIAVDTEAEEVGKDATAVEEFGAYYVPFIAEGTHSFDVEVPADSNDNITYPIVGIIKQETYPFLAHDFYVVQKGEDDSAEYAFVPTGCLTLYTYTPESPGTTVDPDASDTTLVKTVVLSLLLVIVILAIIGLLVFVATGRKYKSVEAGPDDEDNDDGESNEPDKQ